MTTSPDPAAQVAALLDLAGIAPGAEETAGMVATFTASRRAVDALYDVPGVRYESPALTWSAIP